MKKKINGKEPGSFKFDFQELIEKNDLDIGELPEMMALMINKTDEHLKEALAKCTEGHCNSVILELQPYADFILDELYSYYDERISGNLIEPDEVEKVEESTKTNKQYSDLELIIELTKQNQQQLAKINELIIQEKKAKKKKTLQSQLHKGKTPNPSKEIQPPVKELEEPEVEEEKKESIQSRLHEVKTSDPTIEIQPPEKEIEEPKVEEEIVKPNHDRSDEEIILECIQETQEEFTEHDLRKRGFKGRLSNRYVQVGGYVLKKLLFQAYWEIIPASEIIRKS
jgi:hypothetical protein